MTASGFDRELEDAASELKTKAKRNFDAAEAEFRPGSYEDAAMSYQKSIDLLPTMSAYLNGGLSWYYVSNYPEAEQAFLAGLQSAWKKGDEAFEGNFFLVASVMSTVMCTVIKASWMPRCNRFNRLVRFFKRFGTPRDLRIMDKNIRRFTEQLQYAKK